MKPDATQAQIDGMAKEISALGMTPQVITGEHQTVVAALGQERPGLVETLETAGPFGIGWPGPKIALGPVRVIKADVVGTDHVRVIASGQDGASLKAIAFRAAETTLGQTLLHAPKDRRLWLAGRAKIDDWGAHPKAEMHLEDAAWAD
jgi:single-stranded-DNA-specific exonuclease